MPSASIDAVYTVSKLNNIARTLLETGLGEVWLSAEISNFSQPASGHWYFTLKDDKAQVRCAMFRNCNRFVKLRPGNGQQVLVRATVTLYEPRGDFQLIIESIQSAGEGALQQQFEQLKVRLQAEGLFASEYKKPLPMPAQTIGIITSATGAALHDILHVLQRRDPSLPVIIYPAQVQGTDAPAAIVRAIELANQRAECSLLIVARGGGSLEDLSCFNNEQVARAIFASVLPVVSAVGHETDVTIADFVADLRAPTPSAAAELVSRDRIVLQRQLQSQQQQLGMAMDYYLANQNRYHAQLGHRLLQQHPQLRLARQQNVLLQLQRKLTASIQHHLHRAGQQQQIMQQRLNLQQPERRIAHLQQQWQQYYYRLQKATNCLISIHQQRFATLAAQLEGVSPLATLARGYTVTTTADDKVIKTTAGLKTGSMLKTRLTDGYVESRITHIVPAEKKH